MNYCSQCGEAVVQAVPSGDDRERHVCPSCETVHYQNPRIITGCLPVYEDSVLLCRRSIEPRRGYWTLPAGFLENGESVEDGARRETLEEARAQVVLDQLYGVYDILHIAQVYMIYRAHLKAPEFGAGAESLETRLFREEEVPWDEMAFPVMRMVLEHFFEDRRRGHFSLKSARIDRRLAQERA